MVSASASERSIGVTTGRYSERPGAQMNGKSRPCELDARANAKRAEQGIWRQPLDRCEREPDASTNESQSSTAKARFVAVLAVGVLDVGVLCAAGVRVTNCCAATADTPCVAGPGVGTRGESEREEIVGGRGEMVGELRNSCASSTRPARRSRAARATPAAYSALAASNATAACLSDTYRAKARASATAGLRWPARLTPTRATVGEGGERAPASSGARMQLTQLPQPTRCRRSST